MLHCFPCCEPDNHWPENQITKDGRIKGWPEEVPESKLDK
jgi:hypothetical protein